MLCESSPHHSRQAQTTHSVLHAGVLTACSRRQRHLPAIVSCNTYTDLLAVEPAAAQTEAPAPDPLPEPYTSLFKQAKEAPTEFNTWTSLISAAEKLVRMC